MKVSWKGKLMNILVLGDFFDESRSCEVTVDDTNSCYCWSRLLRKLIKCIILYCKDFHCLKKINRIIQNSTASLHFLKNKQEKDSEPAEFHNQHFCTYVRSITRALKRAPSLSLTLSKSRLWVVDLIKLTLPNTKIYCIA